MKNILRKYYLFIIVLLSITLVTCVENHILPNFGTIEIVSNPSGAEVYLDDSLRGTTPLKIEQLLSGTYSISLKMTDFIDTTLNISLDENEIWNGDFFLIESNPQGEIVLTSEPEGAAIFIDGENTGEVTPSTFSNLKRGLYSITLKLNLYNQELFDIDLAKDEKIEKNTILSIASSSGRLLINSTPSGALIYLDDMNTGNTTPFTFNPLSPGSYTIKLELDEYSDTSFTVNVESGVLTTSEIELKGLYNISASVNPENSGTVSGTGGFVEGGTATLTAVPNEGYNFINWAEGQTIVSSDMVYSFTVSEDRNLVANFELKTYQILTSSNPTIASTISGGGEYKHGEEVNLTVSINFGYRFVNWTEGLLEVSTQEAYTFTATQSRNLVANFESIGNLSITSDPVGATIFINEVNSNEVTPHTFSDLVTGNYSIGLKLQDFADTTLSADIFVGTTTELGEIFLRDITPPVEVDITYSVSTQDRITFFFDFNQSIKFEQLIVTTPEEQIFTFDIGQVIPNELLSDIGFPRSISGDWEFSLSGSKIGGRQADFQLFETVTVE